ncbi:transglycosylase SLT domain-containing protein, partial [Klebsiella pneumoniae]|uniref:transglycosylase SLT domain-containing protein n=1 Tax=Klebsiella pneumoniae TaxID=573 RepID=UPI003FD58F34
VNAMLAQIMSESGGNPGIAQQIVDVNGTGESAGVGLLQIIPGTFDAYRDPSLPNDRRDPEANMVAALRYYKARYGTDLTTMWGH